MRLTRFALCAIGIAGGLLFLHSLALAQGAPAPAADPNALTLSMFYPVLAALCGALAGFIRSKTDSEGFWHQWYGHAVIMIGGSFLGAVSDMLARGAITKLALIGAAAGAIGAWASALQNTAKDVKQAAAQTLRVLAIGLILGQLACTPGGKALGNCELGQLPQILQMVIAKVAAIAASPGDWEQDLTAAGAGLAPGQLSCVEQAIAAALQPSASSPDSPTKQMMRERLTVHAAKQPHVCRDVKYGQVTLERIRALVSGGSVRSTDHAIVYAGRALVRW